METIVLKRKYLGGMTDAEFFSFCQEYENLKIERDSQGNIFLMAPTGIDTSDMNFSVGGELYVWNKRTKAGKAFDSNAGFTLPNGAVRSPDAAWLSWERYNRLSKKEKEVFAPVCPDFVIELRSKTDRLKASQEKMEEWMANGCRLAWLIDPVEQKAYVYRPGREVETLVSFDASLRGEEILPGFELDLKILLR
ncbi:MAG: Uma2 family endonuclease [Ferruginibacter sp.]|nr:Uma2 family endonuclease [Cytophagales bacterium]